MIMDGMVPSLFSQLYIRQLGAQLRAGHLNLCPPEAALTAGDYEREDYLYNEHSDPTGPGEEFWSFHKPEGGLISFSALVGHLPCFYKHHLSETDT